ncbi:hypothetical protein PF004_g18202 [Phytophthora fragariae]|uniref:Uncharacterized protein n=1 Tax=Phytophthora fragariae TaxID=53985 RepID=A0A6G0ND70_9STRA|nr:hypothetical protein PF004_g18202 [Phytophthora fragariae]
MESSRDDKEEEGAHPRPYESEPPAREESYQDDSDPGDLEVEERFPDAARAGLVSLEQWKRAADAATRGPSMSEVMRELQGDENEDEYEDLEEKPTVKTEQVAQVAEVKAEPGVKEETGVSTSRRERLRPQPPRQPPIGYARGPLMRAEEDEREFYDALEEPSSPNRGLSGFIPHYTGPEARRTAWPAFGWSWSAQRDSRQATRNREWGGQEAPSK